jgi:DNA-directed RNA polymerase subunit F
MNPKIQEEIPISLYDLKTEISKIKRREKELSLRTGKTEEYLNSFAALKQTQADSLEKDIRKLNIPRLKDNHIKKIIDILPASVDEMKLLFQGYTLTVTKENMQKIVTVVKKYIST